jgi:signal recognition particle subunit SRP54
LSKGEFDFEDFLTSLHQMRKLGPLQQIIAMIPGLNQLARNEELLDERHIKRVEAIIYSMTPEERRRPEIIKGSRRERIARGSGTSVQEVSQLVKQFQQMQRMMKQLAGKGGKGQGGIDPNELLRRLR